MYREYPKGLILKSVLIETTLDKSGPVEIMFTRGEYLVIESGDERFRPSASGAAKITIEELFADASLRADKLDLAYQRRVVVELACEPAGDTLTNHRDRIVRVQRF